jgi:hypothetical protein
VMYMPFKESLGVSCVYFCGVGFVLFGFWAFVLLGFWAFVLGWLCCNQGSSVRST